MEIQTTNISKLEALDVSKTKLNILLTHNLTKLKDLRINCTDITEIETGSLSKLEILNASNTKLISLSTHSLIFLK